MNFYSMQITRSYFLNLFGFWTLNWAPKGNPIGPGRCSESSTAVRRRGWTCRLAAPSWHPDMTSVESGPRIQSQEIFLVAWNLYIIYICIYIYIRQGEEVPREDVNQDHWIGEKTVFHCGKMEIFHVVLFIVNVFQLRIIFFSSVEVEVNYGPSQYVFFWCSYFLHWNYEVHILCYIKDHWKRV